METSVQKVVFDSIVLAPQLSKGSYDGAKIIQLNKEIKNEK